MNTPKVGIILINYKDYAKKFLKDAYVSLMAAQYPKDSYTVYIVDNCTSVETQQLLAEMAPEAVILPTEKNGWGVANNIGAQAARKDGCDFVFLCNMDTIFDPDFIIRAVQKYLSHDDAGAVQSKILLAQQDGTKSDMINTVGNAITFMGLSYCEHEGFADAPEHYADELVIGSGVGLLVHLDTYEAVQGCDESYFMYHDDIELTQKIRLIGKKIYLAPESVIWHKYEFRSSGTQMYNMERNRFKWLIETFTLKTLLLISPAFLTMEIGMFPFSILRGWSGQKLKVYKYFFSVKHWKNLLEKRKAVQNLRTISDAQLMADYTGTVYSAHVSNPALDYIANPMFNTYWKVIKRWI
jgi:GT2 family glycosyltransferase